MPDTRSEIDRLTAELAEAKRLLMRVSNALSDSFSAGMEEREGGSERRQDRYMKSVDELSEKVAAFLEASPPPDDKD